MTPSSLGVGGRTGCKRDVAEWSPTVCVDPGLSNCITHILTVTVKGHEAENEDLSKTRVCQVCCSLFTKNDLLKRFNALVVEEHFTVDTKVYSYALTWKHANIKPFEGSFPEFEDQQQWSYGFVSERPPGLFW